MAFDPRTFHPMLVIDTCSVWNILSATKLHRAALSSKLTFCITPMVLYECIYKPRKNITKEAEELQARLEQSRNKGYFPVQECALEDLLIVSSSAPIGLSSGELSCIAMAYGISTIAFMTDERQARLFADGKLGLKVETTPRLYGWLHYNRHLLDSDHAEIVAEHEKHERRPLSTYFVEAYNTALQYRLMVMSKSN